MMVVVVVVVMILIGHIVYRTVPIPGELNMILISVMVNIIVTVLKSLSLSPLSLFLACAINYCLDCNGDGDCTRCRNGTLLNTTSHPHRCIGNHSYEHTYSVGLIFCVLMPILTCVEFKFAIVQAWSVSTPQILLLVE